MRIAFDHQAFCRQITGGISRYFCRLAEALDQQQQEVGIFAPVYRNSYLKELPQKYVHGFGVKNYLPKTADLSVAANAYIARPMIRHWTPDIVHETYFANQSMAPSNCPVVITVFDMISELNAIQNAKNSIDFKQTDKYKSVSRADHVICISKHTRNDLVRLFDVSDKKVSVVHLGCDPINKNLIESSSVTRQQKPYLLYVGLRGGYKNFDGMLKAIASSKKLMATFDVVAFGGGAFSSTEQSLIQALGFQMQQVRQISGNDQELNLMYQHAAAFIYPSTYEGFGLPPLEAMSLHCPVVSSHVSSMPEVIGDAAEYFEPSQTDSIKNAIEQVVFSDTRTQDLIEKGKLRYQQFTWTQCAEKTLNIYRKLKI